MCSIRQYFCSCSNPIDVIPMDMGKASPYPATKKQQNTNHVHNIGVYSDKKTRTWFS